MHRHGQERRKSPRREEDYGRPLFAHGPIIRRIVISNSITAVCAIIALIFALLDFNSRVDTTATKTSLNSRLLIDIQKSRGQSLIDQCTILQKLIKGTATQENQRVTVYATFGKRIIGYISFGGKDQEARANAFIKQYGLDNCRDFAKDTLKHKRPSKSLPAVKNIPVPPIINPKSPEQR